MANRREQNPRVSYHHWEQFADWINPHIWGKIVDLPQMREYLGLTVVGPIGPCDD